MKKHTKGALAAVAAAALLLGGAGTLAYWNDEAAIPGGEINSGNLALTAGEATGWSYADSGDPVTTIVPGDTIEKTFTFTIAAQGDHLAATLTTPDQVEAEVTGAPTPTTIQLDVDATYLIGDEAAPATITEDNDGDVVTATVTVDFPYGDETVNANDTKDLTASLDDITVSLTHVDPNTES